MIDPDHLTHFDASDAEQEELLLFSVVAAGKPARRQAECLERFLHPPAEATTHESPLEKVRRWSAEGSLEARLQQARLGQYRRIGRCFAELAGLRLDLGHCSIADLEAVYGIGPKTARLFVLHTRPDQNCAALDVHILRFLREHEGLSAPRQTPSSPGEYRRLEEAFLSVARRVDVAPAVLDLAIWRSYAGKTPLLLPGGAVV